MGPPLLRSCRSLLPVLLVAAGSKCHELQQPDRQPLLGNRPGSSLSLASGQVIYCLLELSGVKLEDLQQPVRSLRGAELLLSLQNILCISMLDFLGKQSVHIQSVVPVLPQALSLRSGSSLPGSAGMKVMITRQVYSAPRGAAVPTSRGQAT